MGKCNNQVSILRNQPIKNCPENQCTVGIPIKSSSSLNEFTFCGKYRFKFLKDFLLMYMDGPNSYIRILDFEEKRGFVMHNGNAGFFYFKNQTLVPDRWLNVCMAVKDNGIVILVLNGEIIFEASLKGSSYKNETNLWLGGSNVAYWMYRRLEGAMTEIHLWNKSLNIDDLNLITTNRKESHLISVPALFSWKSFMLTPSCPCIDYQVLDENDDIFRDSFKEEAIVLIEHAAPFNSANQFCKGFGGKFLVPKDVNELGFIYSLVMQKSDKCPSSNAFIGLMKINATKLVDVDDNLAPFVRWKSAEPNGEDYEECVGVSIYSNNSFIDINCFIKRCFVCLMATRKIYSLRGNVPLNIERNYSVSISGKETKIRGVTETECFWNKTWNFGSNLKQDKSVGYIIPPLGLESWNKGQLLKFT